MGVTSLSFLGDTISKQTSWSPALTIFLPSLPLCSLSIKCRSCEMHLHILGLGLALWVIVTGLPKNKVILKRHSCLPVRLWEKLTPKKWEFSSESHYGRRTEHQPEGYLSCDKKFHILLPLLCKTEAQTVVDQLWVRLHFDFHCLDNHNLALQFQLWYHLRSPETCLKTFLDHFVILYFCLPVFVFHY